MKKKTKDLESINPLIGKVSSLIDSAQGYVNKTINKSMVILYWQIGKTIQDDFVKYEKAEYGKRILQTLSAKLDKSGIHVATYLTELPPIEWLKAKLHKSIEESKNRLFYKKEEDN